MAGEAALKLFLVSVVSSAVTLFGISLVYGVTGAMYLDRVAAGLRTVPGDLKPVAAAGIVLVIAGFGFKIAAVPFHFWAPDVYQGAPLPVAAFLSVVSKAGGFAGLTLVLTVGFWPLRQHVGPADGRARGGHDDAGKPRRPAPARRRTPAGLVVGRPVRATCWPRSPAARTYARTSR